MFFILLMLVFICFLDLDWSVCAENFCLLLRRSVQSFNFPPWTAPRTFKPLKIGLFKAAFKCPAQAQFFISRSFLWSTNVVEFRKVTYYFVVPLLGFFVCKHHSTIWKFLLSHLLTKADSLPWNSTIIKIKTRIFGCSNSPPHPNEAQIPHPRWYRCPWSCQGEGLWKLQIDRRLNLCC